MRRTLAELEGLLRAATAKARAYEDGIQGFKIHLSGPKFAGEGDDYIHVSDVFRWLETIVSGAREASLDAGGDA